MPGTTPHGLPYPLPTEPVRDGALRIRELAEAIDQPWTTPTAMGAGFSTLTAYPVRYRVVGKFVELSGSAYASAGVPALGQVLSLPASIMPTVDDTNTYSAAAIVALTSVTGTFAGGFGIVDMRSAGSVVFHGIGTLTGLTTVHFDGVAWRIKGA